MSVNLIFEVQTKPESILHGDLLEKLFCQTRIVMMGVSA